MVLIIYSSTSGNTQLVCEYLTEVLKTAGGDVRLQRAERSSVDDLDAAETVIFAAPTYEHGVIEINFKPLLKALKKKDLKGKPCAVIGLGDTKYDSHYHVESANVLTKAIEQSHGTMLVHPLRINGSPLPQLESKVKEWTNDIIKKIRP